MQRFLTIFPTAENIHLIKDVGMIPYVLHKEFNYDATLACYNNGTYSYLNSEVPGLKQHFIPKIFNNYTLDSCFFILCNFRKYDIVQCFHLINPSLLILFLFKVLKKMTFSSYFTYLKLDADDNIKLFKLTLIHRAILKKINLVSIESKRLYTFLNKNNILERKVNYIPNGFYSNDERRYVDFCSKDNLIITVGRIGTYQKYNETLLEAFKEFAVINRSWKLEVIGPIVDSFKTYVQEYFKLNPNLIDRVVFTGAISDRVFLEEKYRKAKIFVLSSRFEGFPLVYIEAIKAGCTIITSNITPGYDITDNERYGAIFPIGNVNSLFEQLTKAVNNPTKLEKDCELIQDFANSNYSWKNICMSIDKLIKNR